MKFLLSILSHVVTITKVHLDTSWHFFRLRLIVYLWALIIYIFPSRFSLEAATIDPSFCSQTESEREREKFLSMLSLNTDELILWNTPNKTVFNSTSTVIWPLRLFYIVCWLRKIICYLIFEEENCFLRGEEYIVSPHFLSLFIKFDITCPRVSFDYLIVQEDIKKCAVRRTRIFCLLDLTISIRASLARFTLVLLMEKNDNLKYNIVFPNQTTHDFIQWNGTQRTI